MNDGLPFEVSSRRAGAFGGGNHAVVDNDFTQGGRTPGLCAAFIGPHLEVHQVEVGQIRGRFYQEGRVGVVAVVFELGKTTVYLKVGAIKNQVALNSGNPHAAQLTQRCPEPFDGELRVAAKADVEIALEGVASHSAVGQKIGIPVVVGAE